MSARLVELVQTGFASWNAGERSWIRDHMTPAAAWHPSTEDPEVRPYVGIEAIESFWDQWYAALGPLHFEALEILDAGRHVVVVSRRSGRGRSSGLEVSDTIVQTFSFNHQDRCYMVREYANRDEALAHLSEDGSDPLAPAEDPK